MLYKRFINNTFRVSISLLVFVNLLTACSYHGQESTLGSLISDNGKASVHEVSNDKLRSIMHKLDTIVFEPFYSELQRDQYRLRYASQIVDVVNELSHELEANPTLQLGLDQQQQQQFMTLAAQLKQQAQELNSLVIDHRSGEVKNKLTQMTEVCNNCHQQFRSR